MSVKDKGTETVTKNERERVKEREIGEKDTWRDGGEGGLRS